jgi:hypothetical protein
VLPSFQIFIQDPGLKSEESAQRKLKDEYKGDVVTLFIVFKLFDIFFVSD